MRLELIVVSFMISVSLLDCSKQSPGSRHLEGSLRFYEKESWQTAIDMMTSQHIKARGFYHTSTWQKYWKHVIEEQMMIMDGKRNMSTSNTIDQHRISHGSSNTNFTREKLGHLNTNNLAHGSHWTHPRFSSSVFDIIDFVHMTVAGTEDDFRNVSEFMKLMFPRGHNEPNVRDIRLFHNETVGRYEYEGAGPLKKANLDNNDRLSSGEMATIYAMYDYCVDKKMKGEKSFVFYLHNKVFRFIV